MKKSCCMIGVLLALSPLAYANTPAGNDTTTAQTPSHTTNDNAQKIFDALDDHTDTQNQATKTDDLPELDVQNFAMVEHALYSSAVLGNVPAITKLLPIYQAHAKSNDNTSRLLINIASAILAKDQGDYKTSIRLYREVLANYPKMLDIRLNLAELLFIDKQHEAAKDQLVRLRSESSLHEHDRKVLDQYIHAINQHSAWSFGGNLGFAYDPNANNAPKQTTFALNGGTWSTAEAESAQGINYRLHANKSFNLKDNYYAQFASHVSGKFYWSNHDYDDTILKASPSLSYKSAVSEFAISPYVQKRWSANDNYTKEYGVSAEWSQWLSPRHQLNLTFKHGEENYYGRLKNVSSGRLQSVNASYLFVNHARQHWVIGIGHGNKDAYDKSRAYSHSTLQGTWHQEWQKGLSSSLSLSITKNNYQAKDIVGILRKDTEYNANLSLWHRNIYFQGITPRLTISHNNTDSNHPFYQLQKTNAFIEFHKKF